MCVIIISKPINRIKWDLYFLSLVPNCCAKRIIEYIDLDNSGKTSILYRLNIGDFINTK